MDVDRAAVAELVQGKVDVIVTAGTGTTQAAQSATSTIICMNGWNTRIRTFTTSIIVTLMILLGTARSRTSIRIRTGQCGMHMRIFPTSIIGTGISCCEQFSQVAGIGLGVYENTTGSYSRIGRCPMVCGGREMHIARIPNRMGGICLN